MEILVVAIFVVFAISISILQGKNHRIRITEKVIALGGEVISIDKKTFSTGPFLVVARGRTVYRVEYKLGDEIRVGWVKFGDLLGPDWKL